MAGYMGFFILFAFAFFLPKIISIKILLSVGGVVWWWSTYLAMCKALVQAICALVCFVLLVCICLLDRDWKVLTQMACPRSVSHFFEMKKLIMEQKHGSNCLWEGKGLIILKEGGFCVEFFKVCVF